VRQQARTFGDSAAQGNRRDHLIEQRLDRRD
jgi:hypothetical protein